MVGSAVTMLPEVISARLTRPVIGAVTRVKAQVQRARSSCAWMAATAALDSCAVVVRESASSAEMALLVRRRSPRWASLLLRTEAALDCLQLRFQAMHFGFEWPRVDLEQQIAFLHQLAVSKRHRSIWPETRGRTCYGFRCFQARGDFIPLVDRLLEHLGHADFAAAGALVAVSGAGRKR
jgi:hypothetical protein